MEWQLAEEVESPWELLAKLAELATGSQATAATWLEAVLAEMGVVAMWALAELVESAKSAMAC
jgi:hypothetical protein